MMLTISLYAVEYSQRNDTKRKSGPPTVSAVDVSLLAAVILLGAVGVIKMVFDCQVLSKCQDIYRFLTMAEQVADQEKIANILKNLATKDDEELAVEDPDF